MLLAQASSAGLSVAVQATLRWTEYYNGKWQPTKSSDPNRPTIIGSYDPSGPGAFEAFRNRTRIVPAKCTGAFASRVGGPPGGGHGTVVILPSIPDDALILAIDTPQNPFPRLRSSGGGAGFLLHNTHSAATPIEDVPTNRGDIGLYLDVPAPHRQIEAPDDPLQSALPAYTGGPAEGALTIGYFSTIAEVEQDAPENAPVVLTFQWLPRIVEAQPGLPGIWTAPFFYEDRRNLFYVAATADQATFNGPSFGLGLGGAAGGSAPSVTIPPLQVGTSTAGRMTVRLQGFRAPTYPGTETPIAGNAGATAPAAGPQASAPATPSAKRT
jgi:hypothetical protein